MNDTTDPETMPSLPPELAAFLATLADLAVDLKAIRGAVEAIREQLAAGPVAAAPVAAPPPPPTGSPQLQALLRAADQAGLADGVDALRQAGTPEQEAAAVAGWLSNGMLATVPDEVALAVLGWLDGHAEPARQAGLTTLAVAELGDEERPLLRLDGDYERCGVRSLGRVVLPPVRSLPTGATARLALALWEEIIPSLGWRDKLALAGGEPPGEEALAGLLDWLDAHAELRPVAGDALTELGVQYHDAPRQPDDPAFEAAALFRPGQRGDRPLRPAVLVAAPDGERVLRRGRVRRFVTERPEPAVLLDWELAGLLDDLRQAPGPYCRLMEQKAKAIDLDGAAACLQLYVSHYAKAGGDADRAAALGRFVQETLRISPVPPEDLRKDWAARQHEFFAVARLYLSEAGFEIVFAPVGKSSQEHRSDFHLLGKKAAGFNNGAVIETRVAALRHHGEGGKGGFALKGTLYFHNAY